MAADEFSATGDRAGAIAALEGLLGSLDQPPDDDADRVTEVRRLLAALDTVRRLRDDLTRWEPQLIGAARELGVSWAEIAPALGVASRQAAERRYLRLNPDASAPNLTGEQRVQAARDRRAGDRAVVGWARNNSGALRRLAGQVAALDGLDPDSQASADKVQEALGVDDSAALLGPLAEVGSRLADSHPALAIQLNQVTADTDQVRLMTQRNDSGRQTEAASDSEEENS